MKVTYTDKDGYVLDYDTDSVKSNCVDCGVFITNAEANYRERGNYCSKCSAKYQNKKLK